MTEELAIAFAEVRELDARKEALKVQLRNIGRDYSPAGRAQYSALDAEYWDVFARWEAAMDRRRALSMRR